MHLANPSPGDVLLSANPNAWKAGFGKMASLGVGVRNNVLGQLVDAEVTTNQNGAWKWWGVWKRVWTWSQIRFTVPVYSEWGNIGAVDWLRVSVSTTFLPDDKASAAEFRQSERSFK